MKKVTHIKSQKLGACSNCGRLYTTKRVGFEPNSGQKGDESIIIED
jgi:hypothetical protein